MVAAAAVLAALTLAGCGTDTAPGPTTGLRLPEPPADDARARFHVLTEDGRQLDLAPWTACLGNGCVDGMPDDDHLPAVGSPDAVTFGFDLDGWAFESVTFRQLDAACPRRITVAAEETGPRTFRIEPAGPAGVWAVDVFGRGPEGDAVTTFRWRTPVDGRLPEEATGTAAVLADHDGELDSYGVELSLDDLDRPYASATARVQVADADGDSVTIAVPRSSPHEGCWSAGALTFGAPDDAGRPATDLGPGPYTYTATVRLGRTTHTGTGVWPDDESDDMAPYVPLQWEPPLPAYTG